jgi:hypothetical protein
MARRYVSATGKPFGLTEGKRFSLHVVEDLDDLAEQYGFSRWGTVTGWEPRARRFVAGRLGMDVDSFDRAVYRGRAYQKQLLERGAA